MKKAKFENEYFDGYFQKAVGSYTKKDLEMSRNWFYGWVEEIDKFVPIKKGKDKKLLEVGCSIGGLASVLYEYGFDVTATDVSQYVIKNAKKLSPNISFGVLDIQKKSLKKNYFDFAVALEVLEHLESPEQALENIYAMLAKGGKVIFSTPYPYKWSYLDPTHINIKYPNEWIRLMKKSGFKKTRYHKFSLMPYFYKFNKRFHFSLPFHIPNRYINTPVVFIGEK